MTANGQQEIWQPGLPAANSNLFGDGGPPTHGPLRPANVSIEGDYLRWSYVNASERLRPYEPRGMIDRFTRIKGPGDVRRFAGDYGVLGLCAHGFPVMMHWAPEYDGPQPSEDGACWPWAVQGREPLERWYHYVKVAHALMQAAIDLSHGRKPARALWETVLEDYRSPSATLPLRVQQMLAQRYSDLDPLSQQILDRARTGFPRHVQLLLDQVVDDPMLYLYAQVNQWAREGGVHPMIVPQGGRPTLHLGGSVFGLLGVQLMTIITGTASVATCSSCDQPYFRERIPQRGRANYCSDACQKIGARMRKRRERASKPAQKGVNNEQAR